MILLLGGTSESLTIADMLTKAQQPFILSVTTEYGAELARQHATHVHLGAILPAEFHDFFEANRISMVIDATHPFARSISTHVIIAAKQNAIPYIRFERQEMHEEGPFLKVVADTAAAIAFLQQHPGNIYLSTGSKTASEFANELGIDRLHVRVLPTTGVMDLLSQAGYQANQIDAIQGPFSETLNVELIKRTGAKIMVTKESGRRGGLPEKIQACQDLQILCLVIKRPEVNYPEVTGSFEALKQRLGVMQ
ncbi:precorrin-6A reductase [Lentilactobacillus rapi DSM 19907 = JCM 15042]|uniref:Precorrin-6x reductase n=2 Tax=Lentilactobacillus rapi TaxID=481723 RepID=A0A512PK50_9LACO|nr:precorrin-6A reductase [Lentilactobacillus rapi]KRL16162.1 precorrin-6A reductase [Lentilactobacillus rapi DSM 19907 = JCM 15042]GEP71568.1 precorrin-6x reductase [Lentilactobacillus rapi]